MDYFGYTIADYMPCEIPDCYAPCGDVHHIQRRGMGGRGNAEAQDESDDIKNLMGICTPHHDKFGDKKEFKPWLRQVHLKFMKDHGKQKK